MAGSFTYSGNNTVSTNVTTNTTYITDSSSAWPQVVSQQPRVVVLPQPTLAEEPPLAWLRRRVDEVRELVAA